MSEHKIYPKIYRAIGLMSGTSLDGVDAAIIETDGTAIHSFGNSVSIPYSAEARAVLERATQDARAWNFDGPAPDFTAAEDALHQSHVATVGAVLAKANLSLTDIDLIGFHGQTLVHQAPSETRRGQSLQIGDGPRLAKALGVDTVYDFRSADIAAGGQGAPLVPVYHRALLGQAGLKQMGMSANAAVLNIGGVSNFTFVDDAGDMFASDSGPGNGPLDQWVKAKGLGEYDKDGVLSLAGVPDFARVEKWLEHAFFKLALPKSADRYDFDVLARMHGLSDADGAATLCAYCALGVAKTLEQTKARVKTLIVCGGGRRNPAIMAALREALPATTIVNAEGLGGKTLEWDGDALEAQAFAYLAVRSVLGLAITFPETTGVSKALSGGVLTRGAERA